MLHIKTFFISQGIYLNAILYFGPNFSNSAITQSVIHGMPIIKTKDVNEIKTVSKKDQYSTNFWHISSPSSTVQVPVYFELRN
jgi:hypothetical protein